MSQNTLVIMDRGRRLLQVGILVITPLKLELVDTRGSLNLGLAKHRAENGGNNGQVSERQEVNSSVSTLL